MHTRGITLIGVLFSVVAAGVVVGAGILAIDTVLESRTRYATAAAVEGQGQQALQHITRHLRAASSVTTPSAGSEDSEVVFSRDDGGSNPITITIDNGTLMLTRGGVDTALTAAPVVAESVVFANRAAADTPGSLHIELTLSYESENARASYTYEQTFYAAATRRHNE